GEGVGDEVRGGRERVAAGGSRSASQHIIDAMLVTNARIYTMDARGSVADSLVVRDGRIVFCGRRADVNPAAGEPILDLHGRAVLPGLVDAHGHLMHLARARFTLDAG